MSTQQEDDFDAAGNVESMSPNHIRFAKMRVAVFLAPGFSLLSVLFSIWSLADASHTPSIGSLLFSFISMSIMVLFLMSIHYWRWFTFQINGQPVY